MKRERVVTRSVGGGCAETSAGAGRSAVGSGRTTGGTLATAASWSEPESVAEGAGGTESAGGAAGDSHSHVRHSHPEGAGFGAGGLAGWPQHRIPLPDPQHDRFGVMLSQDAAGAAAEV